MKQKRTDAHKILEVLVCKLQGHVPASKTSKHWGVNYCVRCKGSLYPVNDHGR